MKMDYFTEYLLKTGLIEFYGTGKEDWKLSEKGKIICAFIFFNQMYSLFKDSDYYKNLKKDGKI